MSFALLQLRTLFRGGFIALCLAPLLLFTTSYITPAHAILHPWSNWLQVAVDKGQLSVTYMEIKSPPQIVDLGYMHLEYEIELGTFADSPSSFAVSPPPAPLPVPAWNGTPALVQICPWSTPSSTTTWTISLWILVLCSVPFMAIAAHVASTRRAAQADPTPRRHVPSLISLTRWSLTLAAFFGLALALTGPHIYAYYAHPSPAGEWRFYTSSSSLTATGPHPRTYPCYAPGELILVPAHSAAAIPEPALAPITPASFSTLSLPLWLPLLLTAIPTTLLWRAAYRQHKLIITNHCPLCHYNLTGLTEASPCPECGASRTTSSQ